MDGRPSIHFRHRVIVSGTGRHNVKNHKPSVKIASYYPIMSEFKILGKICAKNNF
jgi:hypothetical protein